MLVVRWQREQRVFEKLPSRRSTRWTRVGEFTEVFCRTPRTLRFDAETASNRFGYPIPAAAIEWLEYAASHGDYWTGQDSLWLHRANSADGDFVPLMVENQNCFRMGYHVNDVQQPDPPIHRYHGGKSEFILSSTTTEFSIQMLILEATWSGKHSYMDCVDGVAGAVLSNVQSMYQQAAVSDLCLWGTPTRFLCGNDVIFRLDFSEDDLSHAFFGFAAASKVAFNDTRDVLSCLGYELQS